MSRPRRVSVDKSDPNHLRVVKPNRMRPGGWWDGEPWRDPTPVGPHLHAVFDRESILHLLPVVGRRTRPAPCTTCGGVVMEYDDGLVACVKDAKDGGCRQSHRAAPPTA